MALKPIHPGEHPNRVTSILNGQRAITGDTALRLAHFFGTSPEFWLNLHLYELRLAEAKSGRVIKKLPRLKLEENIHA
jgi:plasmid maintenance system antidote protein VapI